MVCEGESWSERDLVDEDLLFKGETSGDPLGKEKTRGSEEGIADENGTGLGGDKDDDKF
jgi:hypothetical protein